jgi:hypothetical protein
MFNKAETYQQSQATQRNRYEIGCHSSGVAFMQKLLMRSSTIRKDIARLWHRIAFFLTTYDLLVLWLEFAGVVARTAAGTCCARRSYSKTNFPFFVTLNNELKVTPVQSVFPLSCIPALT